MSLCCLKRFVNIKATLKSLIKFDEVFCNNVNPQDRLTLFFTNISLLSGITCLKPSNNHTKAKYRFKIQRFVTSSLVIKKLFELLENEISSAGSINALKIEIYL
jgi:hypothetical protein